eukprot:6213716-Pleurochrysis_carterae.AAC.1
MSAAAHWEEAKKRTVFAAVASKQKGMQGYGHWPGLLVGKLVPAITRPCARPGSRVTGHGLCCITGRHGSVQGCVSHALDWTLSSADQQATKFEKGSFGNAFGEHIRNVVRSGSEGHGHDFVGNAVTNEVPATLDVLCLYECRQVVRQGDGSLVVHEESGRLRLLEAHVG